MHCAAVVKIQKLDGFIGRCGGDGSDAGGERGKDYAGRVCSGDCAVGVRLGKDAGGGFHIWTGASDVDVGVDQAVVGAERDVV